MKKLFIHIILVFFCITNYVFHAHAQVTDTFLKDSLVANGDTLRYRIMYPKDFNSGKKYPFLLFLHGAGERGRDNEKQLNNGADSLLRQASEQYHAIVIAPQCPPNEYWAKVRRVETPNERYIISLTFFPDGKPVQPMINLIQLVESFSKEKFIDKDQMHIGGLSMGGIGTYEFLIRKPDIFASAFVICGATNLITLKRNINKKMPIWIFHGTDDNVISVDYGRQISSELKTQNKNVKYTEYPKTGHNSWDSAFKEKELLPWLFSFKK